MPHQDKRPRQQRALRHCAHTRKYQTEKHPLTCRETRFWSVVSPPVSEVFAALAPDPPMGSAFDKRNILPG